MLPKKLFAVLLVSAGLVGCATQGQYAEPMPHGSVDQVASLPKRQATDVEKQAILNALKEQAKVPQSVEVKNAWVDDANASVRGFCAQARGNDAIGRLMPWAYVVGVLRAGDGFISATDMRAGREAKILCTNMKYPLQGK